MLPFDTNDKWQIKVAQAFIRVLEEMYPGFVWKTTHVTHEGIPYLVTRSNVIRDGRRRPWPET